MQIEGKLQSTRSLFNSEARATDLTKIISWLNSSESNKSTSYTAELDYYNNKTKQNKKKKKKTKKKKKRKEKKKRNAKKTVLTTNLSVSFPVLEALYNTAEDRGG